MCRCVCAACCCCSCFSCVTNKQTKKTSYTDSLHYTYIVCAHEQTHIGYSSWLRLVLVVTKGHYNDKVEVSWMIQTHTNHFNEIIGKVHLCSFWCDAIFGVCMCITVSYTTIVKSKVRQANGNVLCGVMRSECTMKILRSKNR